MDALLLSRLQFVWVIAWHILLPAFTVGLACYIATLEVLWWWKKDDVYRRLSAYWIKIFAVSFGMGVVSGIVMPFQFGTNWSRFSDAAASVIGSLMAYEVLTAFYLEAAFLGVLLFGRKLVPQWAHVFSAVMVALGTLMSSFWILAVNSWMQTPQGFSIDAQGVFQPESWWAIVFNPSFPYRLAHMVLAAFITTCFVIGGVSAWYLRRGVHVEAGKRMLKHAVAFAAIAVPLQVFVGDLHGLNVGEHQPVKLAAMEAHWRSEPPGHGVPLILFAVPNEREERNDYEVAIPKLGSLILTHTLDGDIQPLTAVPREERPPVAPVFYAFRIMVGLGMAMLLLTLASLWAWKRKTLFTSRWLLAGWRVLAPSGFIALLAGWYVVEIGRQPYVVYGLLRTADAVSPNIVAAAVLSSLVVYAVAYAFVFGAGIWYLQKLLRKGPVKQPPKDTEGGEKTPARPLSLPDEKIEG